MSIIGQNILAGASGGGAEELEMENSCRFNAWNGGGDAQLLSRTPGTAGNKRTWTFSAWMKRGEKTQASTLFGDAGMDKLAIHDDYIAFLIANGGYTIHSQKTRLLRDRGAWYHIMYVMDTTQATSTDRCTIYINGIILTVSNTSTYPPQNYESGVNNNALQQVGTVGGGTGESWSGYLAEVNLIDGQALEPSDFGFFHPDTNQWVAQEYSGTYGTNGFRLEFKNSGALGTDTSGNSNTLATTNLAATDQSLDNPSNNFATWNSSLGPDTSNRAAATLTEGLLRAYQNNDNSRARSTMYMATGKWYAECCVVDKGNAEPTFGYSCSPVSGVSGSSSMLRYNGGQRKTDSSGQSTNWAPAYNNGAILHWAYDADAGKVWYGHDGTWYNSGDPANGNSPASTSVGAPASWGLHQAGVPAMTSVVNFGQDSSFAGQKTGQNNADGNGKGDFYYTPPTGFLALCADNLPEPSIVKSTAHFNLNAFDDGAGAKTGIGFQPDLNWMKARGAVTKHVLTDVIRGVTKTISSDRTNAETTDAEGLKSFDSDGYTVGTNTDWSNTTGVGMVGWNWKGGGTGVANTDGNMDTTVSANTAAGFSIVQYEGQSNGATTGNFGHGLSAAPELVIVKNLVQHNWIVYAQPAGNGVLVFNSNVAWGANSDFGGQAPSASVVYLGASGSGNEDNVNHIAYCFHSVDGYSRIGRYDGNGTGNNSFIWTGFSPAWVMVKCIDTGGTFYDWAIYDIACNVYNPVASQIAANLTRAETTGTIPLGPWGQGIPIDILSDGFKIRTPNNEIGSPNTYIFMAFAEYPFKYANAR